ncbi:MAG: DUF6250 domain-containing protein [Armatimonadota bacterium]
MPLRIITLLASLLLAVGLLAADEPDYLQVGRDEVKFPVARWASVQTMTFDDPEALKDCPVLDGAWEVKDGQLQATAGDANRAILLGHAQGDAVRVEFDAMCLADTDGRIGDISVMIDTTPEKGYFRRGYALTTGSYYNTCTSFYRQGKKLARTEYSPLKTGQTYHVAVEVCRGHLRYWLDEKIILEAWDAAPLPLDEKLWVGIRTWATDMRIDNLVISRAGEAAKP